MSAVAASAVILLLSFPAFRVFFGSEDFSYWGTYLAYGKRFWPAVFAPHDTIFFRPTVKMWGLLFFQMLPLDPLIYHLRNWIMTALAVVMLYLLLARLVPSRPARLMGLALFAISKVHLSTIGIIIANDMVMSLIHCLCCLYFLVRYFQDGRRLDLVWSCLFFLLEAFSRDYGIGLILPIALYIAIVSRDANGFPWRRWLIRMSPFAAIVAVYLAARAVVMRGVVFGGGPVYSVHWDPLQILWRGWVFAGNVFNVSMAAPSTGIGSFADLLKDGLPWLHVRTHAWDVAFLLMAIGFLGFGFVIALRRDPRVLVPLSWALAFIGPTFLIRNLHVYYVLEPLAGMALLVAMLAATLQRDYPWWRPAMTGILLVAVVNTAVQSRTPEAYAWWKFAGAAEQAYQQAVLPNRDHALTQLTFVVADPGELPVWQYALTADTKGPMFPTLLGQPELKVVVTDARHVMPPYDDPERPVYLITRGQFLPYHGGISARLLNGHPIGLGPGGPLSQ